MTEPQALFPDPAMDGDDIDDLVDGAGAGQWQSAGPISGGAIGPRSAQRARRQRSADLRSSAVCW